MEAAVYIFQSGGDYRISYTVLIDGDQARLAAGLSTAEGAVVLEDRYTTEDRKVDVDLPWDEPGHSSIVIQNDGDTGGLAEHFVYTVRSLEKLGVSAVIIEDKKGLKKNSLFGTEAAQVQDSIENFSAKIAAGKRVQKSSDFMIIARIESLILKKGLEDALVWASSFVQAGADGIMIHSREQEPDEIFAFIERFRKQDAATPLIVVPTAFHAVTEEEFKRRGVNIVIYANHLMRSQVPAMRRTAETVLKNHRALEADETLLPFQEIIRMIPADL